MVAVPTLAAINLGVTGGMAANQNAWFRPTWFLTCMQLNNSRTILAAHYSHRLIVCPSIKTQEPDSGEFVCMVPGQSKLLIKPIYIPTPPEISSKQKVPRSNHPKRRTTIPLSLTSVYTKIIHREEYHDCWTWTLLLDGPDFSLSGGHPPARTFPTHEPCRPHRS